MKELQGLIEKKKIEFEKGFEIDLKEYDNENFQGYWLGADNVWDFISSSLQEAYKKGIEDAIKICDEKIEVFRDEQENSKDSDYIEDQLSREMLITSIKQQLQKLEEKEK